MQKLFIPVGLALGFSAGAVGRRVFAHIWSWFDDQEPPRSDHQDVPWGKLLISGALQGAIFQAVKTLVDHSARKAFANATGAWPGEARPDSEV